MSFRPAETSGVYVIFDTQLHSDKRIKRGAVRVQSFTIDSALDTDADSFSIDIGTPNFDLTDLVSERDEEIRVSIWFQAPLKKGIDPQLQLFTGFADNAVLDHTGLLQLNGRDMSALALDSQPEPDIFRHLIPSKRFAKEAIDLGFPSTTFSDTGVIPRYFRDGNETYWENWFRAFRKFEKWLWCDTSGKLIAADLGYNQHPSFFFGDQPIGSDPNRSASWIPILSASFNKNTNSRVGNIVVWWSSHNQAFKLPNTTDTTIDHWIKKPQRIIVDSQSKTRDIAKKAAEDEIRDGMVGALELTISVPFTGELYPQNKMCRINIRDMGIDDIFFIVGIRLIGDDNGFIQEIRVRERGYALPFKKPDDPQVIADSGARRGSGTASAGVTLNIPNAPEAYGDWFVQAAHEWAKTCNMDFEKFLAALISIAHKETSGTFKNYLEGNIEYYKPAASGTWGIPGTWGLPAQVQDPSLLNEWIRKFRNESPPLAKAKGVGPMQLTSISYKHDADDHWKKNYRDQWLGGRWHPEHNIWSGAKALANKIKLFPTTLSEDERLKSGIRAYNGSDNPAVIYADKVWDIMHKAPNYLKMVADYDRRVAQANAQDTAELPKIIINRATGKALYDAIDGSPIVISEADMVDIRKGNIDSTPLQAMLSWVTSGGKVNIPSGGLRLGHSWLSNSGQRSQHTMGLAFDNQYYSTSNLKDSKKWMKWLYENRSVLYIHQIIGPEPDLCWKSSSTRFVKNDPGTMGPSSLGDPFSKVVKQLLEDHRTHIHVGFFNERGSAVQDGAQ